MLQRVFKKQFSRDLKLAIRRGKDLKKITSEIDMLCAQTPLPPAFRDHALAGKYAGYRKCHVEPDLLLVYRIDNGRLELVCVRLGTHSDLFGK